MTDLVRCSRIRSEMTAARRVGRCLDRRAKAAARSRFLAACLGVAAWSLVAWSVAPEARAQSVGLPAPRLLTTMPMGGTAGSQIEVTISGENLEEAGDLSFSDPRITAIRKLNAAGQPEPNRYVVTIAADCPVGVHEARVMTRLGVSSSVRLLGRRLAGSRPDDGEHVAVDRDGTQGEFPCECRDDGAGRRSLRFRGAQRAARRRGLRLLVGSTRNWMPC